MLVSLHPLSPTPHGFLRVFRSSLVPRVSLHPVAEAEGVVKGWETRRKSDGKGQWLSVSSSLWVCRSLLVIDPSPLVTLMSQTGSRSGPWASRLRRVTTMIIPFPWAERAGGQGRQSRRDQGDSQEMESSWVFVPVPHSSPLLTLRPFIILFVHSLRPPSEADQNETRVRWGRKTWKRKWQGFYLPVGSLSPILLLVPSVSLFVHPVGAAPRGWETRGPTSVSMSSPVTLGSSVSFHLVSLVSFPPEAPFGWRRMRNTKGGKGRHSETTSDSGQEA